MRLQDTERQKLIALFQMGRMTQLVSLALVFVSFVIFQPLVDPEIALTWLAAAVAITTLRIFYAQRFLVVETEVRDLANWNFGFMVSVFVGGCIWGVTAFAYDNTWPLVHQTYFFLVFAGLVSTTATSYAASLPAFGLYTGSLFVPLFISLWMAGAPSGIAIIAAIYTFAMFLVAKNGNKRFKANVGLRVANMELIESLTEINQELSHEIVARQQVEHALEQEKNLFLEGPVVVFRWKNTEGWPIEYVSPNVEQFGLDPDELSDGDTLYTSFIHPDDAGLAKQNSHYRRSTITQDYRLRLPNGDIRWVYDHTVPIYDENGVIEHFDGYILDITDRKVAEQSVLAEKERVQVTLHSIRDGVITTDSANVVTYLNPTAELLTGSTLEESWGKPLSAVFYAVDNDTGEVIDDLYEHYSSHKSEGLIDVRLVSQDKTQRDIYYSVAPIRNESGRRIGMVVVFHDATKSLALSRELAYHASHDSLTGILNRREFENRLETALQTAKQNRQTHALIYVDLDQFKIINDTCGHRAGDQLLVHVSDTLILNTRDSDVLARLGGDEFAILLYQCPMAEAQDIALKLKEQIRSLQFRWENRQFTISVSMGLAEITETSKNIEEILSAADMACYAAKDKGRDTVQVYRESDQDIAQRQTEMHWVHRINQAIEQDRFLLYGQTMAPVMSEKETTVRKEVLLRMYDEHGEVIPAQTFLSAAERYQLTPSIDRWVIRECLKTISLHPPEQDTIYFINISGTSLSQHDFLAYIISQFEEFGIDGSQIAFEITETAAISNVNNANQFVRKLKSLGCYFALDDFGSGLSSFAYLKDLSVDYLKIEGSFVSNIVVDSVDRALVSAINDVGHVMLIDTVAEHVEDARVFEEIKKIGINYAQGSYIESAEPLPGQTMKLQYPFLKQRSG